MNLEQMKRALGVIIEEMRSMLNSRETRESKEFTTEETAKYDELRTKAAVLEAEIKQLQEFLDLEARTAKPAGAQSGETRSEPFKNLGEFFKEIRTNPNSERLQGVNVSSEERALTMGNDASIGYVVPPEFDTAIRSVSPQEAVFRPRAMIIPSGQSPDAETKLVTLDQTGAKGVLGGVAISWTGEGAAVQPSGEPALNQLSVKPKKLSAKIEVTSELLNNYEALGAFVTQLFRNAIVSAEETAFLSGDGAGKPTGILGHAATIVVDRAAANKISSDDIVTMYSAKLAGTGYAWIANTTALPELMRMKDTAGNLIWQPNVREGVPGTILGLPVIESARTPVLGTEGDLMLVNLNPYYAIKDGSPLAIKFNPYIKMDNDIVTIYAFWHVDGIPLLTGPVKQENGSLVSPFVVLS